jgi:hypothetical protein
MHAPYVSVLFKELNIVLPPPDADLATGNAESRIETTVCKNLCTDPAWPGPFLTFY